MTGSQDLALLAIAAGILLAAVFVLGYYTGRKDRKLNLLPHLPTHNDKERKYDALESISELGSDDKPLVKAPTHNDKDRRAA